MMTDEQRLRVAKLKAAIAAAATTRERTPTEVRSAAVALKEQLRGDGITARALAGWVGVHESTLCRWERETSARAETETQARGRGAGFRLVHVAAVSPSTSAPRSSSSTAVRAGPGLRVAHAPSGLVIDGLDVETLAVLLRRMS